MVDNEMTQPIVFSCLPLTLFLTHVTHRVFTPSAQTMAGFGE